MKNKIIIPVFIVLFLLGAIPFAFTEQTGSFVFGWLPLPLAFWWTLMLVDLAFVLAVCHHFVKVSAREDKGND